ncbi:hypothetical protein Bbelb_218320 [Branchiostoma belcheri]|nr:hypothetical protein Bbelb_218320 [Branchiostoma belcheri]
MRRKLHVVHLSHTPGKCPRLTTNRHTCTCSSLWAKKRRRISLKDSNFSKIEGRLSAVSRLSGRCPPVDRVCPNSASCGRARHRAASRRGLSADGIDSVTVRASR